LHYYSNVAKIIRTLTYYPWKRHHVIKKVTKFQIERRYSIWSSWTVYGVTPCNEYRLIWASITLSLAIILPSEYVHCDAESQQPNLMPALVNFASR
jgi:hypothetical protein